jgi:hypothetical protein
LVGDDVRGFVEKEIVERGLGISDALKEEIDMLISYRSRAVAIDYTLADMISRRSRIGVSSSVVEG